MKKTTYTITTSNGKKSVTGYRKGFLGIHKLYRGEWRLTHIPTGYRLADTGNLKHSKTMLQMASLVPPDHPAATETDPHKASLISLLYIMAKYAHKHKSIIDNIPLEKASGSVFHKDREELKTLWEKFKTLCEESTDKT